MYLDFEYADRKLSDFGCIMCRINTSTDNEIDIGCDITFNTVKNNNSSIHSVASSTYENVYTTEFEIIKNQCNSDEIYMTSLEARAIAKWLNNKSYKKFKPISKISEESNVYYYGSFNIRQIPYGDEILGLKLTFTSNAPYGFGEPNELKYMILKESDTFEVYAESDELGIIYPTVSIKSFYDNDIKITNTTTGTCLFIKNCKANETIILDGEHKIITTDNIGHETTLPNDFNYEYLDILIDEEFSQNIYEVLAPCEISIYYSPARKVGVI